MAQYKRCNVLTLSARKMNQFLQKLFSKQNSIDEQPAPRVFQAEALESRVLYSAAPIDLPAETEVTEVADVVQGGFLGLEGFGDDPTGYGDPPNRVQSTVEAVIPSVSGLEHFVQPHVNDQLSHQQVAELRETEPKISQFKGEQFNYSNDSLIYIETNQIAESDQTVYDYPIQPTAVFFDLEETLNQIEFHSD